jgi:hypothetical protein
VYAPFRLHYYTARHGSSNAAAAAVVVVLIKCFLHVCIHATAHASTPSRPISRTCIAAEHARATMINVARRGKIRPHLSICQPWAGLHAIHSTQLPQLQHACLPAYRPDRVLNLDAQGCCYPLCFQQYLQHSTIPLILSWVGHVRSCNVAICFHVYDVLMLCLLAV